MTFVIDIIAGARPNFMKIAPILRVMAERTRLGGQLSPRLVHTGQHYDARMSGDLFAQLGIAEPDVNLQVGSETQAEQTGAIMIGTLLHSMDRLRPPSFWSELKLRAQQYFVLTMHRPANVDDPAGLARLLRAIGTATRGLPVIFPAHPRTVKALQAIADKPGNLHVVEAQPYLEFNYLVQHAKAVITDSGGITEETTVRGVPCLTLRNNTERPETVTLGTNELLGTDPAALQPALDRVFAGAWKTGTIPEKWDGKAAERIVAALERLVTA